MNFSGFILIGGKSSRMGEDKFSLVLDGKTFLDITVETLQQARIEQVMVVVRSERSAVAGDLSLIKDIFTNRGALSGIHSALTHSKSDWTIILACDYPFVTANLIKFLIKTAESEKDFDAFAPIQKDGKIQPLCAVYRTATCRQILSEMLENSDEKYSVRDFLNRTTTRYIEFSEIADLPNSENFFFNVNTPEDFEKAKFLTINVEKMTVADIENILQIQQESNLGYWSPEAYEGEIIREDSFSITAKINHQTVGFLVGRLIKEENCAELYNIGVDVNFRGKKVGTKLLESFVKYCVKNDLEKIFLEVRESNETAIRFYVQNDFALIGKRKNFYNNPAEDAILMVKEL
jgi:molybdenum cofactor guanylyltransferase